MTQPWVVNSPLAGRVVPLDDVPDDVFAQRVMGDGVAIEPSDGRVVAPVAGRIAKLFRGGHGVALETAEGLQVLIHVGIDTVELAGEGFTVQASEGDEVDAGAPLVTADLARLAELNAVVVSPVVVLSGHRVRVLAAGEVAAGEPLFEASAGE